MVSNCEMLEWGQWYLQTSEGCFPHSIFLLNPEGKVLNCIPHRPSFTFPEVLLADWVEGIGTETGKF